MYHRYKYNENSNAERTKTELNVKAIQELTNTNYATIKLDRQRNIYITTIYDEPGGDENRRFQELRDKLTARDI